MDKRPLPGWGGLNSSTDRRTTDDETEDRGNVLRALCSGGLVRAVSGALQEVPGVDRVVEVSLERGEAIVEGNAETSLLIAAVEEGGYKAETIE